MSKSPKDIAITGMACLFPGAPDLASFAANLRGGVDAVREVPAGRWDAAFYDPAGGAADRFYCKRGGFVDDLARFDALAHGVMPVAAKSAEPDQLLVLDIATKAFTDAGLDTSDIDRSRIGVVIGRGNHAGAGRTRLEQHVRGAEQLVRSLRQLVPGLSEAQLAGVRKEFQAQLGAAGPDAAIGLMPNLTASRIAHRLDLGGAAYTIDAACASALVAVDQAVTELRAGRLDAVIAGGVHFCHDEAFWSLFCQLGALSHAQQVRPFDRRADGILLGEGAGVVVLRRAEDAEREGGRVYATIRGTGVASDGRAASLMSPDVGGQIRALERAWKDAGLDPATIGLLEAHGTGTRTDDAAELETLRRVFGNADDAARPVLGSVKSMIGHTMPAAGIAGLIKAAIALHERTLLPTLHCEEPSELVGKTRFRVTGQAEPWEAGASPRRAAVNAFGFGGIDAHVVLEEAHQGVRRSLVAVPAAFPKALLLAGADAAAVLALLGPGHGGPIARVGEGACRLAVLDATPEKLAKAKTIVEKGKPWRGRDGIWFVPRGLAADGGKLAFLFPGIDAALRPRLGDVAAHFGWQLPAELTDDVKSIEHQGVALVESGRLIAHALGKMGITPDLAFGHSIGEWTALTVAGVFDQAQVSAHVERARTNTIEVPDVAFLAAGCDVERAGKAMAGLPDIAVSHDNCPHQIILCGVDASIDAALARLKADGVLAQKLPFRSGFHSPLFNDHLATPKANLTALDISPSRFPVYSSTIVDRYPTSAEGVHELSVRHLLEPVRFRELADKLHAEGVRLFVQVGPGSALNFIEDTLRGQPLAAVPTNAPDRGGLEQLWRAGAALFVEGLDPDLSALLPEDQRTARQLPNDQPLALGVPLVSFTTPLVTTSAPAPIDHPLGNDLAALLADVSAAGAEILAQLATPRPGRPQPVHTRTSRHLSVQQQPWLMDHTFYRQPPGWPVVSDRHPIVPMTTSIGMMMDEAAKLTGKKAVTVLEVRAFRWLAVATPLELVFDLSYDGIDTVKVAIEGYAECTVVVSDAYPEAPIAPVPKAGKASPIPAERIYVDRWMFHGPEFHGIKQVGPVNDAGLFGELQSGAAPGSLLDNAGQLLGFWVMQAVETDRYVMPIGVDRMDFYMPHPAPGTMVGCDVRILAFETSRLAADLDLSVGGKVFCAIRGWEKRRFVMDARLWDMLRWPEKHQLAEVVPGGPMLFRDIYRSAPARDQLMRRYLGERERAEYEAQPPRGQRGHLNGRIAAKDAIREQLWRAGAGPIFPVEIRIQTSPTGQPLAMSPGGRDVRVSIAHKGDLAVAHAAIGQDVGVDLEKIEPRLPSFVDVAFTPVELALISDRDDRDEWLTRLWTAKEAVGKKLGTGLEGNPRKFEVSDRTGDRLLCRGHWVETRREGDHVIAWTLPT